MRLSRNLIIAIFSLFLITAISVSVVLVIYFNSYVVTYDLDGGKMGETETRVWVGSEYSLPTPTKQGFAFAGWYLDGVYFSPEGVWALEQDVVLTAKWGLRDEAGVVYTKTDGGYVIESYSGAVLGTVILPLTYNNEPVVGINPNALDMLKNRVGDVAGGYIKVYIPSTAVSDDGLSAFDGLVACRYNSISRDEFLYLVSENTATVVGYKGAYSSGITIPSAYDGKSVNAIGAYAFYGTAEHLKAELDDFFRIMLPESIATVGNSAFGLCSGVKASLYYVKDGSVREIIDLSRLYDWIVASEIKDGNGELYEVVTQIRPAFGWGVHTSANYYVRFDSNGGEITEQVTVDNKDGEAVVITVTVKDTTLKKKKEYNLPVPTRSGYTFVGWCYNGELIAQSGSAWVFDTHVELTAQWTEIEKEG